MMSDIDLKRFITESNAIEGIRRSPTKAEVAALRDFLALPAIRLGDLLGLLGVFQPDAVLRNKPGLNVTVGGYRPMWGGPLVEQQLRNLLWRASEGSRRGTNPYQTHCEYEKLHPFTDGNGRTGRALWLWMMKGEAPLGFLHTFYYQALDAFRS